MNRKEKLLNEFEKISPSIVDLEYLEKYIDFCIAKSIKKQQGKTSSHHILPRAKNLPWKKYECLQSHPWNCAELSYYDHYIAHYLLAKAIDHISTLSSFCAMHNKDLVLSRITNNDLISREEYNALYNKRNQKISKWRREQIWHNGELKSRASVSSSNRDWSADKVKRSLRMAGDKNIVYKPGVVEKIRKTKKETIINGKTLDQISAERAALTMKEVKENGKTQYQINGEKVSAALAKKVGLPDGTIVTRAEIRGQKHSQYLRGKGKWYCVKNIFDPSYEKILPAIEVRKISPGLESKTQDNYLGKSKFGQTSLTKKGKANLIGLYVEELSKDQLHHIPDLGQIPNQQTSVTDQD